MNICTNQYWCKTIEFCQFIYVCIDIQGFFFLKIIEISTKYRVIRNSNKKMYRIRMRLVQNTYTYRYFSVDIICLSNSMNFFNGFLSIRNIVSFTRVKHSTIIKFFFSLPTHKHSELYEVLWSTEATTHKYFSNIFIDTSVSA